MQSLLDEVAVDVLENIDDQEEYDDLKKALRLKQKRLRQQDLAKKHADQEKKKAPVARRKNIKLRILRRKRKAPAPAGGGVSPSGGAPVAPEGGGVPPAEVATDEPRPKRGRPAEPVTRAPETFRWGPFSFLRRRAGPNDNGGWQVRCPHAAAAASRDGALLACTRERRNRGPDPEDEDLTIRTLKLWATCCPRDVSRADHMASMARTLLPRDVPTHAELDSVLATWV